MRLLDSKSAEERFADVLKHSKDFLRKSNIDVATYITMAKKVSVKRAAAALVEEAELKNALLPPGYWQSLHKLSKEEPNQPSQPMPLAWHG